MTRKKIIYIIIIICFMFSSASCSLYDDNFSGSQSSFSDNGKTTENLSDKLNIVVHETMAKEYIYSRYSEAKFVDEKHQNYILYIYLKVENKTDQRISFGSNYSSQYYANLNIADGKNIAVYFSENRHIGDRVPWVEPGNRVPEWQDIVFSTAAESETYIEPKSIRNFYLAYAVPFTNQDYDFSLKIFNEKRNIVDTINIGNVPITD